MIKTPSRTVLFAGDTHFHLVPDEGGQLRRERFIEFLKAAQAADDLVLLGDIFDFWFDFPHFKLRGYEDILQALDRLIDSGTTLHFVGGNHDVWAARYFHERYGTSKDGESSTLELDGQRVRLLHGDGLLVRDWIYGSFRKLVRNPFGIFLAKSLHPELLYHFCCWLSGTSRKASRDESAIIVQRAEQYLAQPGHDWDLLLIGHVHHAFVIENEGRRMAALGSWFEEESYGLWQNGTFSLHDFRDGLSLSSE
jgi:UDP-2,3-diacylglucosamine hydrolase